MATSQVFVAATKFDVAPKCCVLFAKWSVLASECSILEPGSGGTGGGQFGPSLPRFFPATQRRISTPNTRRVGGSYNKTKS